MKTSLLLKKGIHQELLELLKAHGNLTISGLSNETAKALLISHILFPSPKTTIIVTEENERAISMRHWLSFFEQNTHLLYTIKKEEGGG